MRSLVSLGISRHDTVPARAIYQERVSAMTNRAGDRRLTILRAVLAASFVSTAVHYTDNYIAFDSYPGSDSISRIEVPISWVILTAIGLAGYVLYRRGRYRPAHVMLGVYALTGLS